MKLKLATLALGTFLLPACFPAAPPAYVDPPNETTANVYVRPGEPGYVTANIVESSATNTSGAIPTFSGQVRITRLVADHSKVRYYFQVNGDDHITHYGHRTEIGFGTTSIQADASGKPVHPEGTYDIGTRTLDWDLTPIDPRGSEYYHVYLLDNVGSPLVNYFECYGNGGAFPTGMSTITINKFEVLEQPVFSPYLNSPTAEQAVVSKFRLEATFDLGSRDFYKEGYPAGRCGFGKISYHNL